MTKLCQILALEKGTKNKTEREVADLHRKATSVQALNGFEKRYEPLNEDGYVFPGESLLVQENWQDAIAQVGDLLSRLIDVTYAKDHTNTKILVDVVVDGETIIDQIPGHHLLFLDKILQDVRTFVMKIPNLDPATEWHWNTEQGLYASEPLKTMRSVKVEEPLVLYPATDRHPAQTQLISKDVPVGTWTTIKYSGAIPPEKKQELIERVDKLQDAVKMALAAGNQEEVTAAKIGQDVFSYLFR